MPRPPYWTSVWRSHCSLGLSAWPSRPARVHSAREPAALSDPGHPCWRAWGATTLGASSCSQCLGLRVGLWDRWWGQTACGLLSLRLGHPDWSLTARGSRGCRAEPHIPYTRAPSDQVNGFPLCTPGRAGCWTACGAAHLRPRFPGEVLGLEDTQGPR